MITFDNYISVWLMACQKKNGVELFEECVEKCCEKHTHDKLQLSSVFITIFYGIKPPKEKS